MRLAGEGRVKLVGYGPIERLLKFLRGDDVFLSMPFDWRSPAGPDCQNVQGPGVSPFRSRP